MRRRPSSRLPSRDVARPLTRAALLAVALLAAPAREAGGQGAGGVAARRPSVETPEPAAGARPALGRDAIPASDALRVHGGATGLSRRAPWWAPAASAIVPGSGQAALGQDRWLAFASVEGLAWLRYAADVDEGRAERRAYRQLADRVARALFGGTRPIGNFEYYEHLEKWVESGVYDAVPGGALDPEPDATTYNGAVWLLARQTYWDDPAAPPSPDSDAYARALDFYEQRAVRPEFRWSWRDAQLQQDLYRRAIARSNAAFRRSAEDLAMLIANHVLSTVDAYVTVRLRRHAFAGERLGVEASVPWPRAGIARGGDDRQ